MGHDAKQCRPGDQPDIGKADNNRYIAQAVTATGATRLRNDDRKGIADGKAKDHIGRQQNSHVSQNDSGKQHAAGKHHGDSHDQMHWKPVGKPVTGKPDGGHRDAEQHDSLPGRADGQPHDPVHMQSRPVDGAPLGQSGKRNAQPQKQHQWQG